jgi:hypothetical protein
MRLEPQPALSMPIPGSAAASAVVAEQARRARQDLGRRMSVGVPRPRI